MALISTERAREVSEGMNEITLCGEVHQGEENKRDEVEEDGDAVSGLKNSSRIRKRTIDKANIG